VQRQLRVRNLLVDAPRKGPSPAPPPGGCRPRSAFDPPHPTPDARGRVVESSTLLLDEIIMAIFVSGGADSTLTRNMFNALRDPIDPTIAATSTRMVLVTRRCSPRRSSSGGRTGIDRRAVGLRGLPQPPGAVLMP